MARERTNTPAELRANVTSPGGTTERAATVRLMDEAVAGATIRRAGRRRSPIARTLAEEFGTTS